MTTVSPNLLSELVGALAAELAPLVAAELSRGGTHAATAEGWRLLNLEDAAACLGRSTRWVRDRVKEGSLPYVRLDGGALSFELDDLRAFARARRVDGESSSRREDSGRLVALPRARASR